jgi:hypothetical protein
MNMHFRILIMGFMLILPYQSVFGQGWVSLSIPQGTNPGEILYRNGTKWVVYNPGLPVSFYNYTVLLTILIRAFFPSAGEMSNERLFCLI